MVARNLPTSITTFLLDGRLGAPLVRVALLMAVGTLDARPVGRLGTIAASVSVLVAVAALNFGHIAWLWTFL